MTNDKPWIIGGWHRDAMLRLRDIERHLRWQRFYETLRVVGFALVGLALTWYAIWFMEVIG